MSSENVDSNNLENTAKTETKTNNENLQQQQEAANSVKSNNENEVEIKTGEVYLIRRADGKLCDDIKC